MLSPPQLFGLAIIAAVLLLIGFLVLRKQPRAIRLFALALLVVGLGYLATTPAPTAITRSLFGLQY